ncbi:EcoRII N-terminal effector-binding domain-containing protein [Ferrovum sp.]|uniref:EcoRII N-terminal effector-binding domain-containing protein n=1 Tax=Ferrovum sp. TaxID=2609467 RepID=UPI002624DABF|nr:EcoRII N-terminal effector-binding domain-containing protein [Ferrovum sp.]
MTSTARITKTLSANDVGETGGHQAGILVPKEQEILSFFPALNSREKNPRITLVFREPDGITRWDFNFIYYNNRFFGGTRNEYRLTCMTKYFRTRSAEVGDLIILSKDAEGRLRVELKRSNIPEITGDDVLVLSGGWKVIRI